METLGQILKRYRESSRLSVLDFSRRTKLTEKIILDLEADSYKDMPGDFYIRGYIKTYASFLKLDQNKLLSMLVNKTSDKENQDSIPKLKLKKVFITPSIIKAFSIGIIAIFLIGYLIFQVRNIFQPPFLEVTTPDKNLAITQSFIDIRGLTEREARVFINNKEIFTDANGFFGLTLDLQSGINLIKISAIKKHSKESVVFREILVQ